MPPRERPSRLNCLVLGSGAEFLDGNRDTDDVARVLAEKSGLDENTAREDTLTTLKHLFELGVLES